MMVFCCCLFVYGVNWKGMQTSNEKNELVDKLTKLFGILGKTGTGSVEDIFNVYT